MKLAIKEENFEGIAKELAKGIGGASHHYHRLFLRYNIVLTYGEVEQMILTHLWSSLRKWKSKKWATKPTQCKFTSFFWTHNNDMMKSFLTKNTGFYKKDGKLLQVKGRRRIPTQNLISMTEPLVKKMEGEFEDEGFDHIHVMKSQQDKDPLDILIAEDTVERLFKEKPNYTEFLKKLASGDSVPKLAKEFGKREQTLYFKLDRIRKHLQKMDEI